MSQVILYKSGDVKNYTFSYRKVNIVSEEMQSFHTTLCPNCGGKQIIAALLGATVGVMTKNAPTVDSIMEKNRPRGMPKGLLKLATRNREVYDQPVVPDANRSRLQAVVCTLCGHTTFYALDLANLLQE